MTFTQFQNWIPVVKTLGCSCLIFSSFCCAICRQTKKQTTAIMMMRNATTPTAMPIMAPVPTPPPAVSATLLETTPAKHRGMKWYCLRHSFHHRSHKLCNKTAQDSYNHILKHWQINSQSDEAFIALVYCPGCWWSVVFIALVYCPGFWWSVVFIAWELEIL